MNLACERGGGGGGGGGEERSGRRHTLNVITLGDFFHGRGLGFDHGSTPASPLHINGFSGADNGLNV